jgi:hypothetical protein
MVAILWVCDRLCVPPRPTHPRTVCVAGPLARRSITARPLMESAALHCVCRLRRCSRTCSTWQRWSRRPSAPPQPGPPFCSHYQLATELAPAAAPGAAQAAPRYAAVKQGAARQLGRWRRHVRVGSRRADLRVMAGSTVCMHAHAGRLQHFVDLLLPHATHILFRRHACACLPNSVRWQRPRRTHRPSRYHAAAAPATRPRGAGGAAGGACCAGCAGGGAAGRPGGPARWASLLDPACQYAAPAYVYAVATSLSACSLACMCLSCITAPLITGGSVEACMRMRTHPRRHMGAAGARGRRSRGRPRAGRGGGCGLLPHVLRHCRG